MAHQQFSNPSYLVNLPPRAPSQPSNNHHTLSPDYDSSTYSSSDTSSPHHYHLSSHTSCISSPHRYHPSSHTSYTSFSHHHRYLPSSQTSSSPRNCTSSVSIHFTQKLLGNDLVTVTIPSLPAAGSALLTTFTAVFLAPSTIRRLLLPSVGGLLLTTTAVS